MKTPGNRQHSNLSSHLLENRKSQSNWQERYQAYQRRLENFRQQQAEFCQQQSYWQERQQIYQLRHEDLQRVHLTQNQRQRLTRRPF